MLKHFPKKKVLKIDFPKNKFFFYRLPFTVKGLVTDVISLLLTLQPNQSNNKNTLSLSLSLSLFLSCRCK